MLYLAISISLLLLLLATAVRSKMAKISNITSYPKKTSPVGADTVIGTDSQDGNATKQFPVSGIINAVATGGGVVTSVSGSGPVNATPTSGDVNVTLNTVPNVANTYQYANIDVDQYGRVVNAYDGTPVTSVNGIDGAVTLSAGDGASVVIDPADPQNIIISSTGSGGSGSVTQVSAGGGIETSPAGGITTTGTVSLQDFGPGHAGSYNNADITIDQYGRVISASDGDGQPNQDLQSVLDTGNVSTTGIVLDNTGITALQGAGVFQDITWSAVGDGYNLLLTNELYLQRHLKDAFGNTGTYQQILISDPSINGGQGGVQWVDQSLLTLRTQIPAATIATMGPVSGPQLLPPPGVGVAIQVIAAAFSYSYAAPVYSFAAGGSDFGLYTNPTTAQFTTPASPLQVPASSANSMSQTPSATLDGNQALNFFLADVVTAAGGGNINLDITYKLVAV